MRYLFSMLVMVGLILAVAVATVTAFVMLPSLVTIGCAEDMIKNMGNGELLIHYLLIAGGMSVGFIIVALLWQSANDMVRGRTVKMRLGGIISITYLMTAAIVANAEIVDARGCVAVKSKPTKPTIEFHKVPTRERGA